jgi:flagellar protein FlaG
MAIDNVTSLTILQPTRGGKDLPGAARSQLVAEVKQSSAVHRAGETARTRRSGVESGEGAVANKRGQQPDSESLAQLVEMVNEQPQIKNRSLQFSVHESTGKTLVQVYDADTDELIRQFPPDELLSLAERIQEILADDSASFMLQEKA